jgi:hypothetical protein
MSFAPKERSVGECGDRVCLTADAGRFQHSPSHKGGRGYRLVASTTTHHLFPSVLSSCPCLSHFRELRICHLTSTEHPPSIWSLLAFVLLHPAILAGQSLRRSSIAPSRDNTFCLKIPAPTLKASSSTSPHFRASRLLVSPPYLSFLFCSTFLVLV